MELVRGVSCRKCRKEQWTVLQETDQMRGSINCTNRPGAGERGGESEEFGDGLFFTESDSLEGIQVLKFQSSFSSYGTTASSCSIAASGDRSYS